MSAPRKPDSPSPGRSRQAVGRSGSKVLPVIQEEVAISRVAEKTGKAVRVRIAAHEERQKVPVSEMVEEVSVRRVPVNRYVDERSGPREEGDVVIIPVFETVSVVQQRLLLREEIHVARHRHQRRREEEVVLRKERPVIERRSSSPASPFKELTMTQTIIGVFETPDSACDARDALIDQGVDESSIYFSVNEGGPASSSLPGQSMNDIRSFLSELFGPESAEDAEYYAEEISRGSVLLSVDITDENEVDAVCDVIEEAGAMDMETLLQQGSGEATEETAAGEEAAGARGETVPVIEEETEIGKQQVGKGTVRVVSRMVETPVEQEVSLREEHATVERRPVDRPVSPQDVENLSGQTIEIEEMAEKPVVSKSARVTEEVEVGKESSERVETVADTERHTEVSVERDETGGKGSKRKGGKK